MPAQKPVPALPVLLPFTERKKQVIDGPRSRKLYSQRMATVGRLIAKLRHNTEKLAKAGFARQAG